MTPDKKVDAFLSQYDDEVFTKTMTLREIVLTNLPNINEQIDVPARMITYCYGQKYTELICMIIPSKKGLKLGFNRGTELSDPSGILEGTGKISRYIVIESEKQIKSAALRKLLSSALKKYKERMKA